MAINSSILAEMEIPETYIASLPKVSLLAVRITLQKCSDSKFLKPGSNDN
jgi:hypothetical protein